MIYIIIPVYNRWHFTKICLDRLALQTYRNFETVVVDHGSTDGTWRNIIEDYSWVTLLEGNNKMWWTAATNLGVQYAMDTALVTDHILTLNNDVEINNNYLENLIAAAQLKPNAIIGSISIDINDPAKIVFAGTKWNSITAKFKTQLPGTNPEKNPEYDFIKSDLLPGRGTLIPVKVFEQIGSFDEINFPHYAADDDFSLRAYKAGYKLYVHTKCPVLSHVEASGIRFNNKAVSFRQFLKSLRTIKSANNLVIRWRWAKKNTPMPFLYFGFDSSRIFFSYLRSCFK